MSGNASGSDQRSGVGRQPGEMAETVLPEVESTTDATVQAETLPVDDTATNATLAAKPLAEAATLLPPASAAPGEDDTVAAYAPDDAPSADDPDGPVVSLTPETPRRYYFRGGHQAAEIGRGGIGRVLVAMDGHLGREIAVKELLGGVAAHADGSGSPPGSGSGPESSGSLAPIAARFLREARITAQLEHPNIVPVYELGHRDDGSIYYTMKLVRGRTLSRALKQCHSLGDRLALLSHYTDLCHAIAYAHSRGVVHRDIKTDNVMVGEFGETVVLDWGLAKVRGQQDLHKKDLKRDIKLFQEAGAGAGKTMDGSALGTPAYMSPEQANGELDNIDERSDVWSLGAVLYEVLTGRPPFVGKSAWSVIEKVRTEPVLAARELDPKVPPELASIAEKALCRDKEERYASAEQLAEEIQAYEAGARVAAYSYSSWELIRRFVAKNRALSLAVALVIAVILVGAIVVLGAYRQAERARSSEVAARQAERHSRVAAENEARRARRNLASALIEKAETLIGYHEHVKARIYAAEALRVTRRMKTQSPARIPPGSINDPRGADLAERIRSALFQTRMFRMVRLIRAVRHPDGPVRAMALSADGRLLATASSERQVLLWRFGKGYTLERLKTLVVPPKLLPNKKWLSSVSGFRSGDDYRLAFSKGGRLLAFATSRRTFALVFDTSTGAPLERLLVPGVDFYVKDMVFAPGTNRLVAIGSDRTRKRKDITPVTLPMVAWDLDAPQALIRPSQPGKRATSRLRERAGALVRLPSGAGVSPQLGKQAGSLSSLAFSASGRDLFVTSNRGELLQLTYPDLRLVNRQAARSATVVAVNPDNQYLAFATHSGNLKQWSRKEHRIADTAVGHREDVNDLTYLPDGSTLVSAGADGTVHLWKAGSFNPVQRINWHRDQVSRVAFISSPRVLISGSWDGTLAVWKLRRSLFKDTQDSALAYSPDGTLVARAHRTAKHVEVHGPKGQVTRYPAPARRHWHLTFSSNSHYLASRSYEHCTTTLWRIGRPDPVTSFPSYYTPGMRTAFSPDGRLLAVPYGLGGIHLVEVHSGKKVGKIGGHKHYVLDVSFSPDGKQLATVAWDKTIRMWDRVTRKSIRVLRYHATKLYSVAYSPNGRYLVTGGDDRTLVIYDLQRRRVHKRVAGFGSSLSILRFSHDGAHLGVGTFDGRIHLLDAHTWTRLLRFKAHDKHVYNLAFSPDGRRLSSSTWLRTKTWPVDQLTPRRPPGDLLRQAERDFGMRIEGFTLARQ